jgi:hypothetical protein
LTGSPPNSNITVTCRLVQGLTRALRTHTSLAPQAQFLPSNGRAETIRLNRVKPTTTPGAGVPVCV